MAVNPTAPTLVVLALVFAVVSTGCDGCKRKPDRWQGLAYPDRSNREKSESVGDFATDDECRAAAKERLQTLKRDRCANCDDEEANDPECRCNEDPLTVGDYECKEKSK